MPHLQIRNVPPELHRTLKVRAAQAGMSLSEYLLREVARSAEHPTQEELLARIRARRRPLDISAAELVREARRDAE